MAIKHLVVTASAAAVILVSGCGATRQGPAERETVAPDASQTFLAITAAHFCSVQGSSYQNPKAMADAYAATPSYPGLTATQVTGLTDRLARDAAFHRRLTTLIKRTCP
ncbi:hypothetical protein GCM10009868_39290 [Terrabacter aerolatus]|uniref:Uncharacterized protein n=1 Tax=Terrabacter aerolatus TaxID=422442 RepID=A0A512D0F8_9MICO|nr:hypothetical protein [Terrabacter aerolatus]GEO29938.1 hypothetical protein TAE01_17480 [Terrabacter aerolatus]